MHCIFRECCNGMGGWIVVFLHWLFLHNRIWSNYRYRCQFCFYLCWIEVFFLDFCFLSRLLTIVACDCVDSLCLRWGLEFWLCEWPLFLPGLLWISVCWTDFRWSSTLLNGFQGASVVSGVQDTHLSSGRIGSLCQKCGPCMQGTSRSSGDIEEILG